MNFKSILYGDANIKPVESMPAFFQDLHLDYLLEHIGAAAKDYDIKPHYYTLPGDLSLIKYRQDVFNDLNNDALVLSLKDFCRHMRDSVLFTELSSQSEGVVQSATYHLKAATIYWHSLVALTESLDNLNFSSEGLTSFYEYIKAHAKELKSTGLDIALEEANQLFSQMCFKLSIEDNVMTISDADSSPNNHLQSLAELLSLDKDADTAMHDVFPNALEPSYLECTLINLLRKSRPDIFDGISNFHKSFPKFYSDTLLNFEKEIQFYLCFIDFKKKTESFGFSLCIPEICDVKPFEGNGIYDIALLWKNLSHSVVSNDFVYNSSPSFFVVTGPNQGGKTTFARSMGQAVYFSMMGLCVNGTSLTLPFIENISTHFEAEEVLQSNSGKLKEEINRLKPMMQDDNRRHFVILNELFTTATTHDALIMGRKVMEHFLKKDCYGIYVTHIQELAEETGLITSLVAQLEPGQEEKRTYRIIPMKAQGFGYSDSLVNHFRLGYEDILRRLS